jgi:tricorn protease-like protein
VEEYMPIVAQTDDTQHSTAADKPDTEKLQSTVTMAREEIYMTDSESGDLTKMMHESNRNTELQHPTDTEYYKWTAYRFPHRSITQEIHINNTKMRHIRDVGRKKKWSRPRKVTT